MNILKNLKKFRKTLQQSIDTLKKADEGTYEELLEDSMQEALDQLDLMIEDENDRLTEAFDETFEDL